MPGIKHYSPTQATAALKGVKLQTLHSNTEENFTYEGSIPFEMTANPRTGYLRVESMTLQKSNGKKVPMLFADFSVCQDKKCEKEQEKATQKSQSMSNWTRYAEGLTLSSIAYGDVNKDGLTDVVMQMSNGAAYMILSERLSGINFD